MSVIDFPWLLKHIFPTQLVVYNSKETRGWLLRIWPSTLLRPRMGFNSDPLRSAALPSHLPLPRLAFRLGEDDSKSWFATQGLTRGVNLRSNLFWGNLRKTSLSKGEGIG